MTDDSKLVVRTVRHMRGAARNGRLERGRDPELDSEVLASARRILDDEEVTPDVAWAAMSELAFPDEEDARWIGEPR